MSDRPTPAEVLAHSQGLLNEHHQHHTVTIPVRDVVDALTAAGYRVVPADQRTVADPDGLLPEGELRVEEYGNGWSQRWTGELEPDPDDGDPLYRFTPERSE